MNWTAKKQNSLTAYLLFFIWPFFSLIFAIVNYKSRFAKNIVWLFCGFYGFTFVLFDDGDAYRYKEWFEGIYSNNYTIYEFIGALSSGVIGRGDYLEPLISYFVSQFTEDYRILFLAYGLFFGYFLSRNVWFVIERFDSDLKKVIIPFLIYFIIVLPVWHISGFRFYAASQVFFFAALRIFHFKKKKYFFLALLTPLIHLSFVYVVTLLIVHFLFEARKNWYLIFFAFAVFIAQFEISTLLSLVPDVGGIYSSRLDAYTHEEMLEAYFDKSRSTWFKQVLPYVTRYFNIALILVLAVFKRKEISRLKLDQLFYFGVLVFAATYILNSIPSIERFYVISTLTLIATTILIIQKSNQIYWLKRISLILYLPMLFLIIMEFRKGMSSMNINLFLTNPVIASVLENSVSLYDLYK